MLAPIATVALGGCSAAAAPEVKVCEAHVQSKLPASASYRRGSVASADVPYASPAALNAATGIIRPRASDPDRDLFDIQQTRYGLATLALRTVTLAYHVDNDDGSKVDGEQVCAFRLLDGELEDADELQRRAEGGGTEVAIATLDDLRGTKRRPAPKYSCCL